MSKIAGLSELQLIYKFLDEYGQWGIIGKFSGEYRISMHFPEKYYYAEIYSGATISDAIRKFYEAESELERD